MKDALKDHIVQTLLRLNLIEESEKDQTHSRIIIERPADMSHGDYATNVAMLFAPKAKKSPLALAIEIVENLREILPISLAGEPAQSTSTSDNENELKNIQKIEIAGPGFINIYLKNSVYRKTISEILATGDTFGTNTSEQSSVGQQKKIAFEYTDPNPFKVFHIGHLMANTAGESLARLAEVNGAEVKRFCYQGDVGRHIALMMWGLRLVDGGIPGESASISEKVAYFGKAYALGATAFKKLEDASKEAGEVDDQGRATGADFKKMEDEVRELNRKIYDRSDVEVNEIYDKGKEWSLQHFEELYEILGTKFDRYFFESQVTDKGIEIVKANTTPKGESVFEESNGAVIFAGEKYGLHTRVFLTKDGLPTYEGKEIGLVPTKYDAYNYDLGFYVTANEQDEYFRVVLKAASFIFPEIIAKTKHVSHGMLKLTTGKMSSRTGDVITGESLLMDMIERSLEKMKDRDMSEGEKKDVAKDVAVAAIKYTVLRQSLGKDVVFDPEKSLSFEGDSGPYLQYAYVRAKSLLNKAKEMSVVQYVDMAGTSKEEGESVVGPTADGEKTTDSGLMLKLEKTLARYPETIERAWKELSPHHVSNYLIDLAGTFSSFYANTQVVKVDDPSSAYKVALVQAFSIVMKNGLAVLGIRVPEKM
ncbi:MAG: arginine--tRNA ligase [Candidatus Pacebacteria bacterium]|nr:arginine--tRNA ligase [Candidatus Paceibacterota bacterium]MBP9818469.1 arginine--tRNA ligase [Candidatus Paceibacterota bacterium]